MKIEEKLPRAAEALRSVGLLEHAQSSLDEFVSTCVWLSDAECSSFVAGYSAGLVGGAKQIAEIDRKLRDKEKVDGK